MATRSARCCQGWVGSSSIKWLHRIVVSSDELWTRNNTTSYVLIGDDYIPRKANQKAKVVTLRRSIKSALALPWPAELSAGTHRIHGYAHSPTAPINVGRMERPTPAAHGVPRASSNRRFNTHGHALNSPGTPALASTP